MIGTRDARTIASARWSIDVGTDSEPVAAGLSQRLIWSLVAWRRRGRVVIV